jgi:hypothetical protein
MGKRRPKATMIPTHILQRLIKEHISEQDVQDRNDFFRSVYGNRVNTSSSAAILHERTEDRLSHKTIFNIIQGVYPVVRLDTADIIIQYGLDRPDLWFCDPELNAVYEQE